VINSGDSYGSTPFIVANFKAALTNLPVWFFSLFSFIELYGGVTGWRRSPGSSGYAAWVSYYNRCANHESPTFQ